MLCQRQTRPRGSGVGLNPVPRNKQAFLNRTGYGRKIVGFADPQAASAAPRWAGSEHSADPPNATGRTSASSAPTQNECKGQALLRRAAVQLARCAHTHVPFRARLRALCSRTKRSGQASTRLLHCSLDRILVLLDPCGEPSPHSISWFFAMMAEAAVPTPGWPCRLRSARPRLPGMPAAHCRRSGWPGCRSRLRARLLTGCRCG